MKVIAMASTLLTGALLVRTAQLQREVDRNAAFRRRQEELARAFQHPGYDYERGELMG